MKSKSTEQIHKIYYATIGLAHCLSKLREYVQYIEWRNSIQSLNKSKFDFELDSEHTIAMWMQFYYVCWHINAFPSTFSSMHSHSRFGYILAQNYTINSCNIVEQMFIQMKRVCSICCLRYHSCDKRSSRDWAFKV